jgi:hypothetical protein
MRVVLILAVLIAVIRGVPTPANAQEVEAPAGETAEILGAEEEAVDAPSPLDDSTSAPIPEVAPEPILSNFRIGFWEIDFFAIDHDPRGDTYRFLDFKIFRFFELGSGPDYQSIGFFEMPQLLSFFTLRRDGIDRELRVFDVQAIALALVRDLRDSEIGENTAILKLPILGSAYSIETDEDDPTLARQTIMYLYRRDVRRAPPTSGISAAPATDVP